MLLPGLQDFRNAQVRFDLSPTALQKFNPAIQAAEGGDNDIGIFDVIGADYWGEGVTAKRISAALRSIGKDNPVQVNINSPGGDMFEGLAIYSLLREHAGEVTVRILGMAASAASIIAMAGDRVEISRAGFFMIHNAWIVAVGNRHDMRDYAEYLEPFDKAMGDIYTAHTGIGEKDIGKMMDSETWIGGGDAIAKGFADDFLPSDAIVEASADSQKIAAHKLDIILAKAGISRSERRKLFNEFKSGKHNATNPATPSAGQNGKPRAIEPLDTSFLNIL